MSIRKYEIAKEFRRGVSDKIMDVGCEDWSKKNSHYMAGWAHGGGILFQLIHNQMNGYLESIGEETMSMVTLQETSRPAQKPAPKAPMEAFTQDSDKH